MFTPAVALDRAAAAWAGSFAPVFVKNGQSNTSESEPR